MFAYSSYYSFVFKLIFVKSMHYLLSCHALVVFYSEVKHQERVDFFFYFQLKLHLFALKNSLRIILGLN